jgi:hypothetical protein
MSIWESRRRWEDNIEMNPRSMGSEEWEKNETQLRSCKMEADLISVFEPSDSDILCLGVKCLILVDETYMPSRNPKFYVGSHFKIQLLRLDDISDASNAILWVQR